MTGESLVLHFEPRKIGAIMTLEAGGKGIRFKPRPIEGTEPSLLEVEPETYILGGQQRLTSLHQAIFRKKPVETCDSKKKSIHRRYYMDMKAAILDHVDMEDVIISVPEDGVVKGFGGEIRMDLSSRGKEYQNGFFPCSLLFDLTDWHHGYNRYWNYETEKTKFFDEFEKEIIDKFRRYQIPVIKLPKETPKEAVCR